MLLAGGISYLLGGLWLTALVLKRRGGSVDSTVAEGTTLVASPGSKDGAP
jgi:hypothetical protein